VVSGGTRGQLKVKMTAEAYNPQLTSIKEEAKGGGVSPRGRFAPALLKINFNLRINFL
jgi:hypothetical protein